MNASLFLEYINKWFPSLSKLVDYVNEKRNGKLTYFHKQMLRREYSADQKWESASVNTTYVAADVVAMDSPLPLKKRDSLAASNGKLPKIGMKMTLGETQINNINLLKARGGNEARITDKMTNDAIKCVTGIDERNEYTFLQGLSTGITLVPDEINVGSGIRVNFNYPEKNKYGVSVKWGDKGYTPISDIQRVLEASDNESKIIMLSKEAYNLIRKSDEAKELTANFEGKIIMDGVKLPVPTVSKFNEAFSDEYFGSKFIIVDRTVKFEIDGKVTNHKPWDTNMLIFLPSEEVGALVYGTLAEETNPVSGVSYAKANDYVLVSKYSKTDPLEEFTAAQALCLPVIENVDQIFQLDITDAQEVAPDEVEGDTTVTIWGSKYTKTEVIDALKAMKVDVASDITDADLIAKINTLSNKQETALKESLTPLP